MEGYLYKWTNYISQWKRRFFVLTGNVLCYYVHKGEKPRGRIHLSISSVNSGEDNLKFEIDTGSSILYLKCESKEEKAKWVKELKRAKLEADRAAVLVASSISKGIQSLQSGYYTEKQTQSHNSFNLHLHNLLSIQSDIKTVNTHIKYLTEDSQLSQENLLDKIVELSHMNEEKLEKWEKVAEELKLSLFQFEKDYSKLTQYFDKNNTLLARSRSDIKSERGIKTITGTIKSSGSGSDINPTKKTETLPSAVRTRGAKSQPQVELTTTTATDTCTYIGTGTEDSHNIIKNSEVFYEAQENESEQEKEKQDYDLQTEELQCKDIITTQNIIQETSIEVPTSKFFDSAYTKNKRNKLPADRKKLNFSIWSILKDALGKDLNKVAVPVYFNEPLSMLQRLCENFQYADLLNKAAKEQNPYMRLALIAAFCIGGYALNPNRTLKFFNPLLAETFEYVDNDMNFRYFSEQVSHHPAISACHVEGDGYTYYANTNVESHFKLMKNSLEFLPISRSYIIFSNFNNEQISFSKPVAAARNIVGHVYIDCYGKFNVTNHTTGDYADFEILEGSKHEQGRIRGEVKNIIGETQMMCEGNWLSHLDVFDIKKDTKTTIWKKTEIPGDEEARFFFTDFTLNLNCLSDELKDALPPTDSRFRPDQRALETQDLDLAAKEKYRLEEKQRRKRKEMEREKKQWTPLYFTETYDDLSGELIYQYSRDYWKDRREKNFVNFPDIF